MSTAAASRLAIILLAALFAATAQASAALRPGLWSLHITTVSRQWPAANRSLVSTRCVPATDKGIWHAPGGPSCQKQATVDADGKGARMVMRCLTQHGPVGVHIKEKVHERWSQAGTMLTGQGVVRTRITGTPAPMGTVTATISIAGRRLGACQANG